MPNFLVRIALNGLRDDDDAYAELDSILLHHDFTRSILGAEGDEYALPAGTYDGDSTLAADELRLDLEDAITDSLEMRFSIVVVQRSSASWAGLPAFDGDPDEDED
jgi:hypothetical protein